MTITSTPSQSEACLRSLTTTAWEDLAGGLLRSELWGRISWLDVKRRYCRTMLGPFWSSITLAVYTDSVGLVGAELWSQNINEYLPCLNRRHDRLDPLDYHDRGVHSFFSRHALFRNVSFEYSIPAYDLVWRKLHQMIPCLLAEA